MRPLPASVSTSNLSLSQGAVTAATLVGPNTVRYTLSGLTTEGTLTINLAAGALTDTFGNPVRRLYRHLHHGHWDGVVPDASGGGESLRRPDL